ncbi:MAG: AAA family ATPase [Sulfolobaceae archaeon]|jgi:cytidylate kinase
MKIIISGPPGSGKSSVAKIISERLSLKYVSAGLIFRQLAKQMGVDLIKLNEIAEENFEIDKYVDYSLYNEIKNNDNLIIESHIAGWLFKQLVDLTVYLNAPLEIRAKRISLRDGVSEDDALVQIMKRERSHKERFLRYYGIDIFDLTNFDLVINTQYLKPNDVADLIITFIKKIQQTPPS